MGGSKENVGWIEEKKVAEMGARSLNSFSSLVPTFFDMPSRFACLLFSILAVHFHFLYILAFVARSCTYMFLFTFLNRSFFGIPKT